MKVHYANPTELKIAAMKIGATLRKRPISFLRTYCGIPYRSFKYVEPVSTDPTKIKLAHIQEEDIEQTTNLPEEVTCKECLSVLQSVFIDAL